MKTIVLFEQNDSTFSLKR